MTRPTKEQIESLAAWAHWKKRESGLSESDQEFVQAVSAILEEVDALNANQCTGCCYQAESVDCDLRELAELRGECAVLKAEADTLRNELKMLQEGALRNRETMRKAREALLLYNQLIDSGWLCRDTSKDWALKQIESVLQLKSAYGSLEEIDKVLGDKE